MQRFLFVSENGLVITQEEASATNMQAGDGILIFGTKGGLKIPSAHAQGGLFNYYTEQDDIHQTTILNVPLLTGPGRIQTTLIDRDFATACLEDKPVKTPGEDGLRIMQIISMGALSAKLGREATLKDL